MALLHPPVTFLSIYYVQNLSCSRIWMHASIIRPAVLIVSQLYV